MTTPAKSLSTRSAVSQQMLRSLGFDNITMQNIGTSLAAALTKAEQEFTLRPRVTREVHLLKFRTVLTSREMIVRFTPNRNRSIVFRFIEHGDRFVTDGVTRSKTREVHLDLTKPNIRGRFEDIIYHDVLPWLQLSAESIRKPSIRMPVLRQSNRAKSKFLPASFMVASHSVTANEQHSLLVVHSEDKSLSATVPFSPSVFARLQDPSTQLYAVVFISGNVQVLDEATFEREFIYMDDLIAQTKLGVEVEA